MRKLHKKIVAKQNPYQMIVAQTNMKLLIKTLKKIIVMMIAVHSV